MNKNSNLYQILYAAVMVLLVGTVLAFIYMALKPKQNENIANDTRKQILSALHIAAPDDSQVRRPTRNTSSRTCWSTRRATSLTAPPMWPSTSR